MKIIVAIHLYTKLVPNNIYFVLQSFEYRIALNVTKNTFFKLEFPKYKHTSSLKAQQTKMRKKDSWSQMLETSVFVVLCR